MTEFERMARRKKVKCDICGRVMKPVYGDGWKNDQMVCPDIRDCGVEIVFPTSTDRPEIKLR